MHQDVEERGVDHGGSEQESGVVELEFASSSAHRLERVGEQLATAASQGSGDDGRGDDALVGGSRGIRHGRDRESAQRVEAGTGSDANRRLLGDVIHECDRVVVDQPPADGPDKNGRVRNEQDRAGLASCSSLLEGVGRVSESINVGPGWSPWRGSQCGTYRGRMSSGCYRQRPGRIPIRWRGIVASERFGLLTRLVVGRNEIPGLLGRNLRTYAFLDRKYQSTSISPDGGQTRRACASNETTRIRRNIPARRRTNLRWFCSCPQRTGSVRRGEH